MLTSFLNYIFLCLSRGEAVISHAADFLMHWCLGVSIVLAGAFYALEGQDGMPALIRRVFAIGVISYLFTEWNSWSLYVQNGFLDIAQQMVPGKFLAVNFVHPNDIWQLGRSLILKMVFNNDLRTINIGSILVKIIITVLFGVPIVLFAFLQAGISAMLVIVAMKLLATFGVLLIPFNLLSGTEFLGQQIFSKLIATALKLALTYFCVAVGYNFFSDPQYAYPSDPSIGDTLDFIGVAMAFGALVRFAPDFVAGFVSGAPSVSQLLQPKR